MYKKLQNHNTLYQIITVILTIIFISLCSQKSFAYDSEDPKEGERERLRAEINEFYRRVSPELREICEKTYHEVYSIITSKSFDELKPEDIKILNRFTVLNNALVCKFIFEDKIHALEKFKPQEDKLTILIDWALFTKFMHIKPEPTATFIIYDFLKTYARAHQEKCKDSDKNFEGLLNCIADSNGTYFIAPNYESNIMHIMFLLLTKYADKINVVAINRPFMPIANKDILKFDSILNDEKYPVCAILVPHQGASEVIVCPKFNLEKQASELRQTTAFNPRYLLFIFPNEDKGYIIGLKTKGTDQGFIPQTRKGYSFKTIHETRFKTRSSDEDPLLHDFQLIKKLDEKIKKNKISPDAFLTELNNKAKTLFCVIEIKPPYSNLATKIKADGSECGGLALELWKAYYRMLSETVKWFEKEFKPRGLL